GRGFKPFKFFFARRLTPVFFTILSSAPRHQVGPALQKGPVDKIVTWLSTLCVPDHPRLEMLSFARIFRLEHNRLLWDQSVPLRYGNAFRRGFVNRYSYIRRCGSSF